MLNSNALLVQVHKYGRKQVSCTVPWVLYGAQVRLHMAFLAHNQKSSCIMRPVSR